MWRCRALGPQYNSLTSFGTLVLTVLAQGKAKAKTLLHFAFVVIAVCMVLDSVLLISLCFRHASPSSVLLAL